MPADDHFEHAKGGVGYTIIPVAFLLDKVFGCKETSKLLQMCN